MTGILTKDLLCVRGCQTETTGIIVVVPTTAVVAAVSITFFVASVLMLVDVATTATAGLLELFDGGVGGGGFFDLLTVGVTVLLRLFEGTEELRPRLPLGSSVAVC